MKGRIAIIGDGDSVLAFKSVGIDTFPVKDADEARATVKRLSKDYQIIMIVDTIAVLIDDVLIKYRNEPYPAIISIPSKDGGNGYGMEGLKREMERALGVDILFKNGKEEQK